MKRGPARAVRRGETGTALVVTLLIITTLVGMTIAFSEDAGVELSLAGYSAGAHRSYQIALAGFHLARAMIHEDEDQDVDSLREDWGKFGSESLPEGLLANGSFSGRIVDESAKLNVNQLRSAVGEIEIQLEDRFRLLFSALHIEERHLAPLLDWLDADEIQRLDGAENDYYQRLPDPYPCANQLLLTPGQVFLIKGWAGLTPLEDREEGWGMLDFLTVYGDGKININTAPPEVLKSLHEAFDGTVVDAILSHRKETDFKDISELKTVIGLSDQVYNAVSNAVTVKSSAFLLEMEGQSLDARTKIRAVLVKEGSKTKLAYWQVS